MYSVHIYHLQSFPEQENYVFSRNLSSRPIIYSKGIVEFCKVVCMSVWHCTQTISLDVAIISLKKSLEFP